VKPKVSGIEVFDVPRRFAALAERRIRNIRSAWGRWGDYSLNILCQSCYLQGLADGQDSLQPNNTKVKRPERSSGMHYANGKEAKVGDKIVGKDVSGNPLGGIVAEIYPDTDTCNLIVILTGAPQYTATAGECLLVEDINQAYECTDKPTE